MILWCMEMICHRLLMVKMLMQTFGMLVRLIFISISISIFVLFAMVTFHFFSHLFITRAYELKGRLKIIKRTPGVSTTDLVGRLLLMTKEHLSIEATSSTTSSHTISDSTSQESPTTSPLSSLKYSLSSSNLQQESQVRTLQCVWNE